MVRSPSPPGKPRLNPFAFPPEISLRFGLLLVFALCSATVLFKDFWFAFHDEQYKSLVVCASNAYQEIFSTVHEKLKPLDQEETNWDSQEAARQAVIPCERLIQPATSFSLLGVILTIALAFTFYWLHPWWKISGRASSL